MNTNYDWFDGGQIIVLVVKMKFYTAKNLILFLFFAQNIDCGYKLEPRNKVYPCKPQIYYIKVGFSGYSLHGHVFLVRMDTASRYM